MVQSNLQPPALPRACVLRPRLLAALDEGAGAGLVLVTGVAGAGKSTLVLQWLASRGGEDAVAWLTLDPHDNDPHRFWSHLGGAVRRARPDFTWEPGVPEGAEPADALTDALPDALPDATSFVDALGSLGAPLVLVVDDVHVLVEDRVLRGLELLAGAVLPDVVLVLVTRVRPDIRLQRRAASHGLVEITGAELMLTDAETADVLVARGLDPGWTRQVQRATGGWPVAVSLTARLAPGDVPFDPGTIRRARRDIGRYLTEEILRNQPADVQRFLLDSCILDEISAAAANAVRGRTDAAQLLEYLDRHDLFVNVVNVVNVVDAGTTDERWRHHAVVRDHLRSRLADHEPDRWTELHRRAGTYFEDQDVERAVAHHLAAQDHDRAADLIEAHLAGDAEHTYAYRTLLSWLEALPDHLFTERPSLRAVGINTASVLQRPDLAARWIRARTIDQVDSLEDLVAESWKASMVGDLPRLRETCRKGLELCDPSSHWWRPLHGSLAAAEVETGDLAAGLRSLVLLPRDFSSTPAELYGAHELILTSIAVLHAKLGHHQEAATAYLAATEWVDRARATGYTSQGLVDMTAAILAYCQGDLAAAARWSAEPTAAQVGGRHFVSAALLIDRAMLRRAAGDLAAAERALMQARAIIDGMVDPGDMRERLELERALLGDGRPSPASLPAPGLTFYEPLSPREQEVLRLLRSEYSLPEIAGHLFVSYNTAKTHTKTIYRKLGVRTRSSAVARARDLGYLDRPREKLTSH